MKMTDEEDLAIGIHLAFERNFSVLGHLHHRDAQQSVARSLTIDDRLEVLLHARPGEVFQSRFDGLSFDVAADDPREADVEIARRRGGEDVLPFARSARTLHADDAAGE